MKLSKILFGGAVLALSLAFVGCATDDDTEGAISGSGSKYTLDYTNAGEGTYRCYNGTNLKHESMTTKITLKNQSADADFAGVMGVMFDFKDSAEVSKAKDFFVVGLNYNYRTKGKLYWYVSKMKNIVDIQAGNFGASTTATGTDPHETEFVALESESYSKTPKTNGDLVVVVNVVAKEDGGYTVNLYDEDDLGTDGKPLETAVAFASTEINAGHTGYDKPTQSKLAVYANIQSKKTLQGTWEFTDVVKEAEELIVD